MCSFYEETIDALKEIHKELPGFLCLPQKMQDFEHERFEYKSDSTRIEAYNHQKFWNSYFWEILMKCTNEKGTYALRVMEEIFSMSCKEVH